MTGDIIKFKGTSLPSQRLGSRFEQALQTASDSVEVANGDGLPFLKLNKVGEWYYGKDDIEVEEGSHWAINPSTLEKGWIYWKNRKATKRMKNVLEGLVSANELPDLDGDWKENVSFQLQCVLGEDEGTVLIYETSAYGGRSAWKALVNDIRRQMHDDPKRMVPVVELFSESYMHSNPEYGKIWNPIFKIVKWIGFEGAQEEEEPAPSQTQPAEQNSKGSAPAEATSAKAGKTRRRVVDPAAVTDVKEVPDATPAPEPAADPVQRRRRRAAA